ncbi:MAG: ParB/RepB/Spo0J family partition protein [Rhodospirillaceae bacterium]
MSIQSVPLSSLQPPAANPRTVFDDAALEGLADSIAADGLLQNLVVAPAKSGYRVISGERRYRALRLLAERGVIDADHAVPVEIRKGLSKQDTLRIATVENLQRADLPPLDAATALAALIRKGTTLDDLVASTGLSATTIRRRLALNGLCNEARTALGEGAISLTQAEALTLATPEQQEELLPQLTNGRYAMSADDIREQILDGRPSAAMAIFPLDRYTGTLTTDLFQSQAETYFDDADQFMTLQAEAVEALAAQHGESAAWVEVTNAHRIPDWQYEEAEEGAPSGVVINLSPLGRVEVRTALAQPDHLDDDTATETADAPSATIRRAPAYGTPLRRTIAWHKSLAVQEVLLAAPDTARLIATVRLWQGMRLHPAHRSLPEGERPVAASVLESQASMVCRSVNIAPDDGDDAIAALCEASRNLDEADLYRRLRTLDPDARDTVQAFFALLSFGQADCDRLDTADSLFNAVAIDLGVDMRHHWRPDAAFLNRRNRTQLIAIATECGYAEGVSGLQGWKKVELVNALLRHFDAARTAAEPTPAQMKARNWLPEAMSFPAVAPDVAASEPCEAEPE